MQCSGFLNVVSNQTHGNRQRKEQMIYEERLKLIQNEQLNSVILVQDNNKDELTDGTK